MTWECLCFLFIWSHLLSRVRKEAEAGKKWPENWNEIARMESQEEKTKPLFLSSHLEVCLISRRQEHRQNWHSSEGMNSSLVLLFGFLLSLLINCFQRSLIMAWKRMEEEMIQEWMNKERERESSVYTRFHSKGWGDISIIIWGSSSSSTPASLVWSWEQVVLLFCHGLLLLSAEVLHEIEWTQKCSHRAKQEE